MSIFPLSSHVEQPVLTVFRKSAKNIDPVSSMNDKKETLNFKRLWSMGIPVYSFE